MSHLPRVAIFDWDGTLVDTRQCINQSVNDVLAYYELPLWEELKSLKITERNKAFKSTMQRIFKEKFDEAFELYRMTYLNSFKNLVQTYENSYDVMNFLKSKDVKIHIISNKDSFLLNEEIAFFYGRYFFNNILGYDDYTEQKPSANIVDISLFEYGNIDRSKDVVFVGDAEIDILCALRSKCIPVLMFADNFPSRSRKKYMCMASFKDLHAYFLSH